MASSDFNSDGLSYHVLTPLTSVILTQRTGRKGDHVDIPETVTNEGKTYLVTEIGRGAFQNRATIASVRIPNSVVRVDVEAFQGCTGLTSIALGSSLTEIGSVPSKAAPL